MQLQPYRMLKIAGIGALVLIGGVLVAAAFRADSFRVQRSARIQAPAEKIFPLINDLRGFNTWNPFDKKDPHLKASHSGAAHPTPWMKPSINMKAIVGPNRIGGTLGCTRESLSSTLESNIRGEARRVSLRLRPSRSST